MGKASKWFRSLLGLKKTQEYSSSTNNNNSSPKPPKHKRRWSFVKSYREENTQNNNFNYANTPIHQHHPAQHVAADPNKRAIAVAAAAAAVAEAAVSAAQAAAVVVRLTSSSGRCAGGITATNRQEWAAVKIQAAFRGCLARRALRALKGLVKLQALVRGRIERKRTAEELKRMQALLRAQARARAGRAHILYHTSNSSSKSSSCHPHGPATPDKFESPIRSKSMKHDHSPVLKRNSSKSCVLFNGNKEKHRNKSESQIDEQSSWTQERSSIRTCSSTEKSDSRNLEVDSGKPQVTSKRRNLFPSTSTHTHNHAITVSDHYNIKSWTTTKDSNLVEESPFCTAENSPQFLSASSKDNGSNNTPFTPNKSEGSRSYFYGYSDYPSYMAYTESSKAKVRSLSAPKQRPQQYERTSSSNRYSLNGFGESRLGAQRVSTLQSSFTSKAYPGSGRLDKLGMPVGYRY